MEKYKVGDMVRLKKTFLAGDTRLLLEFCEGSLGTVDEVIYWVDGTEEGLLRYGVKFPISAMNKAKIYLDEADIELWKTFQANELKKQMEECYPEKKEEKCTS